ncbi:T9SS type A sorting domain-containing protein [Subsaxibacter sp. CAU 1640]|uniref:T9SS type A sorting domain-containing protein n=1 Tax=Subsaxibacter sp. CAU 1640 TaxID=2933271 RepID=UPI0020035C7E|nr:T9SS type A sorting domain-containing protein [Subsaxibacter sp. CAU 1640]MCK7589154.1 T9SS type A sorting domain-containing protein [Subsaxibacter sp. CAU 1640]
MKKIYFLLLTLLISSLSFGQLVINEIDADTPGSDTAEFLELKWTPNTALDGYIVVFFNGSNDLSYATIDLAGKTTDAAGFFILANESLAAGQDVVLPAGGSGFIQNGADAVAIYQAAAASFPDGSSVTTTGLVDALVYGTADADDMELLTGLGETVQYDESANSASATESIQRKMDGTYETKAPTFRAENDAAVCDLSLISTTAACDAFTAGTDTYSVSIVYTGGGTSTYTITPSVGTVGGDDPSLIADGIITINGISEGTDVSVSIGDGGLCDLMTSATSPSCVPANTLPLYEGFNYTVGANLGDQPNWRNINSGDEILIGGPGGLTYPGLASSSGTGNHVSFAGIGIDDVLEYTPVSSGTVYASFIFTVTDQSAVTDLTDGGYFAGISSSDTAYDARLWVRPNPDASGNTFDIGVGNTGLPTVTPGTYTTGTNIFAVMSYDIATGNISAWINPDSGTFGAGSAPTATITAVDASPASSLNSFILRQDSDGETPAILFDELRIGTTWASVTPTTLSVGENSITDFKIYPNPTSVGYVNIASTNTAAMSVSVFDVLGKQVLNQTLNNNRLNVASLKSGIYIMKISQDNATITKKLVIK